MSDVGAGVLAKKEGCTRGCNCVVGFFFCVVVSTFVGCFLVWRGGLVKGCFVR